MKVVTWHSENAPAGYEWCARWQITDEPLTKPSETGAGIQLWAEYKKNPMSGIMRHYGFMGWASKTGLMQRSFYAAREDLVIAAAQAGWDKMWAEYWSEKDRKTALAKKASGAATAALYADEDEEEPGVLNDGL